MKILILAVLSLGFLAQTNAQRRRPDPGNNQPVQDNVCNFQAKEVTLGGSGEKASSLADCEQQAFQAAHRYCEAARAGNAGDNPYNPINTSWTWNGQKGEHPNFACENVAINRKSDGGGNNGGNTGRPGGGGGGRPGGGGNGGGNTEPTVVERFEFTEATVRGWGLPDDVCLVDHPRWGRDFRRNRDRFTIDREDAFCDWDERRLRYERCLNPEQPVSSVLPGTETWAGDRQSVSLSNQGQPVTVTLQSTEYITEQYFADEARDYNCSERDDFYRVRYTTYQVTRWSNGRRDRREIRTDTDMVQGIRLKRDPVWVAKRRNILTGETSSATFTLEPQAFETQLNYTFAATIAHNKGTEPTVTFSDEFFSHNASAGNVSNGGTISVQSYISPIAPPSVSVTMNETDKRNPVLEKLVVNDPRLPQLRMMSSDQMQTTYTIYGRVMHKRALGDRDFGSFTVVVPNKNNTPVYEIDMEEVLRIAAQQTGNSKLILDRKKNTYELKLQVSASRTDTKFVTGGEGPRTPELKVEVEKF